MGNPTRSTDSYHHRNGPLTPDDSDEDEFISFRGSSGANTASDNSSATSMPSQAPSNLNYSTWRLFIENQSMRHRWHNYAQRVRDLAMLRISRELPGLELPTATTPITEESARTSHRIAGQMVPPNEVDDIEERTTRALGQINERLAQTRNRLIEQMQNRTASQIIQRVERPHIRVAPASDIPTATQETSPFPNIIEENLFSPSRRRRPMSAHPRQRTAINRKPNELEPSAIYHPYSIDYKEKESNNTKDPQSLTTYISKRLCYHRYTQ